jgi:hypothetical protein
MDLQQLFFQRYDALYNFWIGDLWTAVPDELIRQRPHTRVNSIVWNLWHLTRVEDVALNRFIADFPQILDEGGWMQRMKVPFRHHGGGMTLDEVDELDQSIDVQALHGYSNAVQARTREIVNRLSMDDLDAVLEESRLRKIMLDEGVARNRDAGTIENYLGWSKGKSLMNLGLTHPYQHVGEIGVIATLLGIEFE